MPVHFRSEAVRQRLLLALAGLLLVLLSALAMPARAAAAAPPGMLERALAATVMVSGQSAADRARDGDAESAQGAGFVFDAGGLILTSAHVVAKVDAVEVTFRDGRRYAGAVIGRDGRTDLAVIRIKPEAPLAVLRFAAAEPALGAAVYALGNPLGRAFSVSGGIVSGFDRAYDTAWPVRFLQHDAALNPGNSGGPLVDANGEVVGINAASPAETLFDIGIGFAVPASLAARIAPELAANGHIARGRLGITGSSADASMTAALGGPDTQGLLIDGVTSGEAAERAGLAAGDVILSADDKPLATPRDLSLALLDTRPGQAVRLSVLHARQVRDITVKLGEDQALAGTRGRVTTLSLDAQPTKAVAAAGPDLELGDDGAGPGAAVTAVTDNSLAGLYGIYPGDRVMAVNGLQVIDAAAAKAALAGAKGDIAVLQLRRVDGTGYHVALPLSASAAARRRPGSAAKLPQGPL